MIRQAAITPNEWTIYVSHIENTYKIWPHIDRSALVVEEESDLDPGLWTPRPGAQLCWFCFLNIVLEVSKEAGD